MPLYHIRRAKQSQQSSCMTNPCFCKKVTSFY